jgi:hypothetical protein
MGALSRPLTPELMARAETLISASAVRGGRYNAQSASEVDTEEFAA